MNSMCSMTNHSVFGSQKTYTFSVVDGSAITITGYTSAYMFIKSTGSITLAKTTNVKVIVVGGGGGGGGAGYGVGGIGGAGGSGVVIIVYDPAPGLVYTTYSNKTIGNDQPNFFNYLSFIGGYTADATRGVTLSTFSYILKIATLTVLWTGFFVPNITGIWYFSGSADDQAALFISPNPITNTASGYIFAANDACSGFTGNAEGTISLTANVRYYMSVLYSNTGGDIAFNMFNAPPPTSGGTGSSANRTTDFTGLIFQS